MENQNEAENLEILLSDDVTGVELVLTYTIYANEAVITRHARFQNKGEEPVVLDRALSACVEFKDSDFEMIHLAGAWSRERYVKTRKLESWTFITRLFQLSKQCIYCEKSSTHILPRRNDDL